MFVLLLASGDGSAVCDCDCEASGALIGRYRCGEAAADSVAGPRLRKVCQVEDFVKLWVIASQTEICVRKGELECGYCY